MLDVRGCVLKVHIFDWVDCFGMDGIDLADGKDL